MENLVVVFSGYNQRAVIAFLRTLRKNAVPFVIVAQSLNDSIFDSDYRDYVYEVRSNPCLDVDLFKAIFNNIKKDRKVETLFIAPSTEALNRFLLDNLDIFSNNSIVLPLVDREKYLQISDKYDFGELCIQNHINVPKNEKNIEKIGLPCVAKPYKYLSKANQVYTPQLIYTKEDRERFLSQFDEEDFYYQEFILGNSYYLLYYFDKDKNVYKYSQQNIAQQPNGKSILAATSSTIHGLPISDKYESMLKSLNFRGLIMIEVKKQDGIFYMIEANPRFWGPSQLFVDAQCNFFECLLFDYGILDLLPTRNNPIESKYFWYGGFVESSGSVVYHMPEYNLQANNLEEWLSVDVYKRKDTIRIFEKTKMMTKKEELIALYANNSKHSNYQILSNRLSEIIDNKNINVRTRFEQERLDYILKNVSVENKSILDIGANTGFFSFELLEHNAKEVYIYEGNKQHAHFITVASDVLGVNNKIEVTNRYFTFDKITEPNKVDIVLLLNVLHHVGDDYGDDKISLEYAKDEILRELNSLAEKTTTLVFQLGFNWKGNSNSGLFEKGLKSELISFIKDNTKSYWDILKIGIAVEKNERIEYTDLDQDNILRDDSLGEFLNRPLFIMRSKKRNE